MGSLQWPSNITASNSGFLSVLIRSFFVLVLGRKCSKVEGDGRLSQLSLTLFHYGTIMQHVSA